MLMAAVAGECSRFQLIPPNFFFPRPFLPELNLCEESGPAFVMFNLVQAPGRLKLALGFGHDTLVPVVFALWPRLPAWPLEPERRRVLTSQRSEKGTSPRQKEDSAPGGSAGRLDTPAFRLPLALQLGPGLQPSETPHLPGSLSCLALELFSHQALFGILHSASVWFAPSSHTNLGSSVSAVFILVGIGQGPGT